MDSVGLLEDLADSSVSNAACISITASANV